MKTQTAHRPPRKPGRLRQIERCGAAAMVSAWLAFQLLSLVHFFSVPHAVDMHTGEVIHVRVKQVAPASDPKDNDSPAHTPLKEPCRIFALLHTAKIATTPNTVVPSSGACIELSEPVPDTPALKTRPLYLLAPSHSPPLPTV